VSAHDALVALAQDLVQEIAAGMAVELAAAQATAPAPAASQVPPAKKGAAAVHPQLGTGLAGLPGDTISGLAYAHLQPSPPPGAQPPIAGQ
jgi:hypothetical protein